MTAVDHDLERRLATLATMMDPPADELVERVMARVANDRTVSTPRGANRLALLAAAAIVAVLVATVLVIPAARDAAARWFGLGNTRIELPVPSAPITTSPATFPASLALGVPVTAADATAATGLGVPTAAGLGQPSGIFVVRPPAAGQIVVAYPPSATLPATPIVGIGALLSVAAGRLDDGLYVKVAGMGTMVERVPVTLASGAVTDAIHLSGEPHQYAFETARGEIVFDTLRLATDTLLWSDGDAVYRLESQLTLDQAVAIAATVTAG